MKSMLHEKRVQEGGYSALGLAAILSLFAMTNANAIPNPALVELSSAFPGASFAEVSMIATLPSLTMLPFVILAGKLVASGVRYRTVATAGLILVILPNLGCAFLGDLVSVLACRALFGVGFGLVTALANPLIVQGYPPESRSRYLGFGTAAWYIGSIAFYLASGFIASFAPQEVFLLYGVAFVPLALVVGLPQPPSGAPSANEDQTGLAGGEARDAMSASAVIDTAIMCAILLVFGIAFFPWLIGMSAIVEGKGLGGPALAGVILAVNSIGAVVAGFATGGYVKLLQRKALPIALLALGLSLVAAHYASSVTGVLLISLISGFFLGMPIALCNASLGNIVPPSKVPLCSNALFVAFNVGGFLSSFWMAALGSIATGPDCVLLVGGAVVCALGFATWFLKASGRLIGNAEEGCEV